MDEADKVFTALRVAYKRGANWMRENAEDGSAYLEKAAYDYADKMTGPGAPFAASPAPALPESGVEGLTAAWLSAKAQKLYQTRSVGDVEGFEAASALWSAAQCIAALATPAPAPAPAPDPVDAAGLVSRALGFAQDGKFMSDEAAKAVADLAAAFTADAEREHLLQAKLDRAKDDLARCCEERAAAAEREAALMRDRERWEAVAEAAWSQLDAEVTKSLCETIGGRSEIPPHVAFYNALQAAEARVTAAEAEGDKMRVLLVQAKDRIALNAADLSMHSADYLLVSRICAAIRKETTA